MSGRLVSWFIRWVATVSLVVSLAPTASADDDFTGDTEGDGLFVYGAIQQLGNGIALPIGPVSPAPQGPQIVLGAAACDGADQAVGTNQAVSFCQHYVEPATPVLTVGVVRRAFAELKLPAGTLVIEPPDGLTLVNFDTNFYTTSTAPISRTVTLLGRRVTLEATPDTFHWRFDDGEELTTHEPGAPYPRLDVTHNYLRTGTYRPSLSTTYSGRYRVGDGPWRQIPGTVTIDGAGQALRAIEAQPKLVGY